MTVTLCCDVSAAAWLDSTDSSWGKLVCLGPDGFERYARLRFIPDPTQTGQREGDVAGDEDRGTETEQLRTAVDVLSAHTTTVDDCYFALWDGWGVTPAGGPARPTWQLPDRDYFLFQGPLSALGDEDQWREALRTSDARWWLPVPAFVWPADRAWCLTKDVDPHYAGIGASGAAIEDLLVRSGLDLVLSDPADTPPHYS
ncbi:hypothetical protein [Kineococcus siccus]|uniref:hypothetical protein n=1 Tax=Kineococcus siccus TaxID=2696567 RepID=UPI00196B0B83|nr:hypothetical protein [Kineococcus siccus]